MRASSGVQMMILVWKHREFRTAGNQFLVPKRQGNRRFSIIVTPQQERWTAHGPRVLREILVDHPDEHRPQCPGREVVGGSESPRVPLQSAVACNRLNRPQS